MKYNQAKKRRERLREVVFTLHWLSKNNPQNISSSAWMWRHHNASGDICILLLFLALKIWNLQPLSRVEKESSSYSRPWFFLDRTSLQFDQLSFSNINGFFLSFNLRVFKCFQKIWFLTKVILSYITQNYYTHIIYIYKKIPKQIKRVFGFKVWWFFF